MRPSIVRECQYTTAPRRQLGDPGGNSPYYWPHLPGPAAFTGRARGEHPMAPAAPSEYYQPMIKPIRNILSPSAATCTARQFTSVFACCGALGLLLSGCATDDSHL